MLYRYGAFVVRHAKSMLVVAALVMIAAGFLGAGAFGKLKNGGFADERSESARAQHLIDTRFGGETNLVLLVTAKSGTVDDAAAAQAGRNLAAALSAEADVSGVASYWGTGAAGLRSADATSALVLGHVAGDDTQLTERARTLIGRYAGDRGAVTVRAGGQAGINHDVNAGVTRSLAVAESIAVPLTMLLLILAFGSVVAALLPLVVGLVAVLGTFAELSILGSLTDVSVFSINLTTALGLGLGVDYALFMVSRYREQLAAGDPVEEAVARTVASAGRTILFTAAAVMAALSALLVFPLYFLRSFGYAGVGVVAIAAAGALVVLPALLALLGHRVNAGRVRFLHAAVTGAASPRWARLAATVMRRPAITALPVIGLLLLAASPLLGVSFGTPDQTVLHRSAGSRQVADAITADFPGNASTPIDLVTEGPVAADALATYARTISELPGVAGVSSSAGAFSHGEGTAPTPGDAALAGPGGQRLTVVTTLAANTDAARDLVRTIRATPGPAGVNVLTAGSEAQTMDTRHAIGARLPLAIGIVLLTTLIVLFLFTGSVVQPVRAVVLNALSLSATLGVLTWIFQDGHLAGLLGVTARPMDMSMTVLLFCIAFGLSMDYEVFTLSRIKELHDRGESTAAAVTAGLSRTGRIVTTAAGLLAVTLFAFGTADVSFLQLFGIGSGLAILIDATLVRGVLVPASMRLLGAAAWYSPKPLRRAAIRLALNET